MGAVWTDHDVPTLVLAARNYQRALAGSPQAASEYRQWADRFGLSPLARRKNLWLLPGGEDEAEAGAAKADATVIRLVAN